MWEGERTEESKMSTAYNSKSVQKTKDKKRYSNKEMGSTVKQNFRKGEREVSGIQNIVCQQKKVRVTSSLSLERDEEEEKRQGLPIFFCFIKKATLFEGKERKKEEERV